MKYYLHILVWFQLNENLLVAIRLDGCMQSQKGGNLPPQPYYSLCKYSFGTIAFPLIKFVRIEMFAFEVNVMVVSMIIKKTRRGAGWRVESKRLCL